MLTRQASDLGYGDPPRPRATLRSRLLRLNRVIAWIWFIAMGVLTFVSARRNEPITGLLLGIATLVRVYLFCHAGIALWAYRVPRPRFTRFHFILYSGYLILFITLLGFVAPGSWQMIQERASWSAVSIHIAIVSWSACTRYRFSVALKVLCSAAVIFLVGFMAAVSLSAKQ